uniref:Insulin-like domain-containing protein n=1 Tax=Anopheles quadriannulatus TaxID=34691 RepID=A0A182XPC1_ANOQN
MMKFPHNTFMNVGVLLVLLIAVGSLQPVSAKRYCGDQLPKILAMLPVTSNQFPGSQLDWAGEKLSENGFKRSFNVPSRYNHLEPVEDEFEPSLWFRQKPYDRFMVPHLKARFRRDVADECCREDCSMAQLLSYCKVVAPGVVPT